jgi:hypothetical protein
MRPTKLSSTQGAEVDRCRRYRHCGAKSRSPGVAAFGKERVIVYGAGRRNWLIHAFWFRRTGSRFLPLASRSF